MKKFIALFLLLAVAALCQSLPDQRGAEKAAALVDVTVSFAEGASLSSVVDLKGYMPFALRVPSTWTAANVTVQACTSTTTSTCADVYDDAGNELTVTVGTLAAARVLVLTAADFAGIRFIRLRSGTGATPVAQVAAIDLLASVRRY